MGTSPGPLPGTDRTEFRPLFGVGGTDFVNLMKQSHEFGLNKTAQLVGLTGFITDILAMGPTIAQGTVLTENFYWDMMTTQVPVIRVAQKINSDLWMTFSPYDGYRREMIENGAQDSGRSAYEQARLIAMNSDFVLRMARITTSIHELCRFEMLTVRFGSGSEQTSTLPTESRRRHLFAPTRSACGSRSRPRNSALGSGISPRGRSTGRRTWRRYLR